jgi:electron transport complex protein RnfB
MMAGLLIILMLSIFLAILAENSRINREISSEEKIDRVNILLPQTQCGQCSFDGCEPYATAIAEGITAINQCPPGGNITSRELSRLTGSEYKALNQDWQSEPLAKTALIDEELCIGCVKCISACPVDAIIGAPKQMHTVIPELCTGCELCIAPCPVDCIQMEPKSRIQI